MIRKTLVINGVTRNLVLEQDETLAKVLREYLLLIPDMNINAPANISRIMSNHESNIIGMCIPKE